MASPPEGGASPPSSTRTSDNTTTSPRVFDEPMPYVTGHHKRMSLVTAIDLTKDIKPVKPQKIRSQDSLPESKVDQSDPDRPTPKELRDDYLERINLDIPTYPLPPWKGASKVTPPQLARILKVQRYLAEEDAKREELERELEKDELSIRSVGRARHKILNPDDLLEHEAQSQINAILAETVKAELDYEQSLQGLLSNYLEPIFASKLLAPGVSEAFGKFMRVVSAILKLHHDMGGELQSKLSQGSLDMLNTFETFEPLFDPAYPAYMKQMPFVLTETSPDRVPALGSLLQSLDKENTGSKRAGLVGLLDDPMRQIESYIRRLNLLNRLLPVTHPSCAKIKRLLSRFRDRGKLLQEALNTATEGAQLSDLEARVTSVPDHWAIRDSRHLFASVLVTQLYGLPSEHTDAPMIHPHKSKKGETCRLFALDHCLLITSFDYKYRQRIDYQEITASGRGEHLLVLSRQFLALGSAATEDDPATPITLLFNSFQERNVWIQKITDWAEVLSAKLASDFIKLTEDSGKFSESQLLAEDKEQERINTYDASSPVTIFFRVRPFVLKEEIEAGTCSVQIAGSYAAIEGRVEDDTGEAKRVLHKVGVFANVFSTHTPQLEVLSRVEREPLDALMSGSNALVLTYGGIGTGKTYTMFGHDGDEPVPSVDWGRNTGVVQRLIEQVFVRLKAGSSDEKEEKVTLSCLQVFNDKLQDLQGGKILQDIKSVLPRRPGEPPAIVRELTETQILSGKEANSILKEALRSRVTRSHPLNENSSRSHVVVIVRIKCKLKGDQKRMALYMVDLAGFDASGVEVAAGLHAHDMQDRAVNASLISLERVLNGLGEKRRAKRKRVHIPFGEHKLSLVLTDVLSSDHTFPTTVILTASPSSLPTQMEATLKTLQFGDSVKKYGGHRFGGQGVYVRQGHWTEGLQKLWDRL